MKKLLLLLFVLLPMAALAEEIAFTKYITYKGSVDANGKPSGKGKIEVTYNQTKDLRKDVLEGVFANAVVTDAKLTLEKYNGPFWINSCTYKGVVEYSIANNGKSITFKLKGGKIKDASYSSCTIVADYPLEIKRTPHDSGCELKTEAFYTDIKSPTNHASITEIFQPFNTSLLGSEAGYTQGTVYDLGNDWKLNRIGEAEVATFSNGSQLMKVRDRIGVEYSNGDNITYDINQNAVVSFTKTYQDTIVTYNIKNTKSSVQYPDGAEYVGSLNFEQEIPDFSDYFKKVMLSDIFTNSGVSLGSGTLTRNEEQITYKDGKSSEDLAREERQRKEKAQIEKQLAEKELQEKVNELSKKYGVTNDKDGKDLIKVYTDAEEGMDEAWAIVGNHFYKGKGVKKNITKAIECYKKAMASTNESHSAKCFGMLFMADLYWKGIGVAKDRVKAAIYYADCLKATAWAWSIYGTNYAKERPLAALRSGTVFEQGVKGVKYIDAAIECYRECVSEGTYDEITAEATYKLGYYMEKGRYKAKRNRFGTYTPNYGLARTYYHDAITYGDAKTKSLAKQGLQRIGF